MREELPAVTGQRMAGIKPAGTWDSALTSDEFAAIRGVGFEPVGQVFGAAVYSAGSASASSCPGAGGSSGGATRARSATYVSGQGGPGSFAPLVRAMNQARHTAIDRMTAECAALGGHGVVGVRLSRGPFILGGLEFNAIGTAVRAPGAAHGPRAPFTSDLSGQDFAKLIMTGWVPAEVGGWSELVGQSRRDARGQLESDVRRLGAEGVVIATMQMRVRDRDCPVQLGRRDHIVEATLIGTAIARFSPAGQRGAGPALAIMSLGA